MTIQGESMEIIKQSELSGDITERSFSEGGGERMRYECWSEDNEIVYDVSEFNLDEYNYLSFDILAEGAYTPTFELSLIGEVEGRFSMLKNVFLGGDDEFSFSYSTLNQCLARVRIPIDIARESTYKYPREGGRLKAFVGGDSVTPSTVENITHSVASMPGDTVQWLQTPVRLTMTEPDVLEDPKLPEGPLLDEFGQYTLLDWPNKIESQPELEERISTLQKRGLDTSWSDSRSRWGGYKGEQYEATGYFRTERRGETWWFVDPDGHPFWSIGVTGFAPRVASYHQYIEEALSTRPANGSGSSGQDPHTTDFLQSNLKRVFGETSWYENWLTMMENELCDAGFNTLGVCPRPDKRNVDLPYVRQIELDFETTSSLIADFPDIYHENFLDDVDAIASKLQHTANDPSLIGYFLDSYPEWTQLSIPPALGMLKADEFRPARRKLVEYLEQKYINENDWSKSWNMDLSFSELETDSIQREFTDTAEQDLEEFSTILVDRLYRILDKKCREYDDNHLNLGTQFHMTPLKSWILPCLEHFDVISSYCFSSRPQHPEQTRGRYRTISEKFDAPLLISEFSFGAADVGLPSAGLQEVPNQQSRGEAYRTYVEDAAAKPWCVGTHFLKLYDQSAIGRGDGENFNVGIYDVCNQPYEDLLEAAKVTNSRIYELRNGDAESYEGDVE